MRRQFLPLASEQMPDHPMARLDSLAERTTRRCPAWCTATPTRCCSWRSTAARCTAASARASYAVGLDTDGVDEGPRRRQAERWEQAFEYIREHPEIEDVVISGGDVLLSLRADQIAADRRHAARHPAHPPHALRHQGPGGACR